jgi:hypothetical protein
LPTAVTSIGYSATPSNAVFWTNLRFFGQTNKWPTTRPRCDLRVSSRRCCWLLFQPAQALPTADLGDEAGGGPPAAASASRRCCGLSRRIHSGKCKPACSPTFRDEQSLASAEADRRQSTHDTKSRACLGAIQAAGAAHARSHRQVDVG